MRLSSEFAIGSMVASRIARLQRGHAISGTGDGNAFFFTAATMLSPFIACMEAGAQAVSQSLMPEIKSLSDEA